MSQPVTIPVLSAVSVSLFFLVSCASVPRMEIDAARKAIMESEKLNAPKYAPNELSSAIQFYKTATNQVSQKQNKQAKQSAIDSRQMGDRAYYKSLDEFLKDQDGSTKKTLDEAQESHADIAVPDKYQEAQDLYDAAQKEMNELKTETIKLQQLNALTGNTNK